MKHYKSDSFVRKIEVNLANVSAKPTDKFQLIKAYYDIDLFDCTLCGHKNCMYAYEILNIQTKEVIKVGSECINHFADKGVDINLAEGLMRRVTSASNKARRDLKKRLGTEAFNNLTKEEREAIPWYDHKDKIDELGKIAYKAISRNEKRELVVNEFLTLQTKELLCDVADGKSILNEEDVELILQLNMKEEMDKAISQNKIITIKSQIREIETESLKQIREIDIKDLTEDLIKSMKQKCLDIDPTYHSVWIENTYQNRLIEEKRNIEIQKEFGWLIDYTGNNPTVRDIQGYLKKNRYISPAQQNLAWSLVEGESHPVDKEFEEKIEELNKLPYNKFVSSVYTQFKRKGYVSERQKLAILKHFDKVTEKEDN